MTFSRLQNVWRRQISLALTSGILLIPLITHSAPPEPPTEKLSAAKQDLLFQTDTSKKPAPANSANGGITVIPAAKISPAATPAQRLAFALKLEKKRDFRGIIETLKPASDKLSRQGLLLLSKAYGKTADDPGEMRTLELVLAQNAKDYYAKTALAEVLLRMKRFDDATAAFNEARELNPKFEPAYSGLLRQLEKSGDSYEAVNLVNDMIKNFGNKPAYVANLCRLYSNQALLEKAIETCEQAIEMNGNEPLNFMYLGICLKEKEQVPKATKLLEKAALRFPKSEPVQSVLAQIYLENKSFPKAYQFFKKAIVSDPKSGAAQAGLGNAAFELQKYEESAAAFMRACTLDKKYAKEFRAADGKLRARHDMKWQTKFEDGILHCPGN
jgi:tetratricopeptide (TPR) repeat protein